MPVIGCGLDKLDWHLVSSIIDSVFKNLVPSMKIQIYSLDDSRKDAVASTRNSIKSDKNQKIDPFFKRSSSQKRNAEESKSEFNNESKQNDSKSKNIYSPSSKRNEKQPKKF
jgi:hypothetical protein